MKPEFETAYKSFITQLCALARDTFGCNILPFELKKIQDMQKMDFVSQLHLPMLLAELKITYEQILSSGGNYYLCCLPVEIDHWDYLVTPTHRTLTEEEVVNNTETGVAGDYFGATGDGGPDNISDWQFEAWLEGIFKTEVLSVGAIQQEDRRFRTFKWLIKEPNK